MSRNMRYKKQLMKEVSADLDFACVYLLLVFCFKGLSSSQLIQNGKSGI